MLRRPCRRGDRERPPCHRAGGATRATSPASPATRRSSRRSGAVYCGDLDRYVELTREVAALPGTSRAFAVAAYVDGLQSAGRVEEALALTGPALEAARELGNPYWIAYTLWIVGLAQSKVDPQSALETWDEGVAYIGEHDIRFFEGFMARDAALLHTSDGQLETALTLFAAAIEAFLRAGAVAQLTITIASLPALFERLGRPAAAGTLLGVMSRHPDGFHHVPSLADLDQRLRDRLGQERADRCAASGAALDLPEAAAYALHQIGEASTALVVAGQRGGPAGLTAREAQVLGLIAEGAEHPRHLRTPLHLGEDRRQPHPAHLHQARRDQPSSGHPVGARPRAGRADHRLTTSLLAETGTRNEEISSCARTPIGTGFTRSGDQRREPHGSVRTRGETKETQMILATTQVKDLDQFLAVFGTAGADKRGSHGSKGATVYRDPMEENRVWVLFDWDNEGWTAFATDPETPGILQQAGHLGKPSLGQFVGTFDA